MLTKILLILCALQMVVTVLGQSQNLQNEVGTCESHTCEVGKHCELEQIVCCCAPCDPRPKCVPNSESTLTSDNTIPIRCRQGFMYILRPVECEKAPCFPIPQCIPESCRIFDTPAVI